MKKLAIVLGKIGPKKQAFIKYLSENLKGTEVVGVRVDEISLRIINGATSIIYSGKNLADFDLVYFRRIGNKNLSIVNIMSDFLAKKGTNFIDRALQIEGRGEDKLTNNYILSESGIPVADTVFSRDWAEIESSLKLPVIAKDIDKQRNEGIYTLKSKQDYERLVSENPESRFIYQKFMNIDKEYRLLVMGAAVRTVLVKDPRVYDFKVEPPADPTEVYLPVESVGREFRSTAVRAAEALGLQVAGVDLMIEKGTGKPYIIEVNRGPGITVEVEKSPELPAMADYLREELAK